LLPFYPQSIGNGKTACPSFPQTTHFHAVTRILSLAVRLHLPGSKKQSLVTNTLEEAAEQMKQTARTKGQAGYSMMELLTVMAMSIIVTAIALPTYMSTLKFLRTSGDLRMLNAITAQAKMRAAANFTHARVYADLTHGTYQLQVWYKTGGSSGTGCWVSDADPGLSSNNPTCITWTNAPAPSGVGIVQLGQGDTYGFGSLTAGPTPGQSTISQGTTAEECYQEGSGRPDGGSQMANTACIEFNSRGIPVDNSGNPVATGAFYITNGNVVDTVTASATGSIQPWSLPHGQTTWQAQ
jgi:type II secretory pathway pseudopilin PulG